MVQALFNQISFPLSFPCRYSTFLNFSKRSLELAFWNWLLCPHFIDEVKKQQPKAKFCAYQDETKTPRNRSHYLDEPCKEAAREMTFYVSKKKATVWQAYRP